MTFYNKALQILQNEVAVMDDNLKAELLKQFPVEAIEIQDQNGNIIYACPKCRRAVAISADKCNICSQKLSWNNVIMKSNATDGSIARIEFEIPKDFTRGDCRKCPLSYITKKDGTVIYDCPLNMKTNCKLKII